MCHIEGRHYAAVCITLDAVGLETCHDVENCAFKDLTTFDYDCPKYRCFPGSSVATTTMQPTSSTLDLSSTSSIAAVTKQDKVSQKNCSLARSNIHLLFSSQPFPDPFVCPTKECHLKQYYSESGCPVFNFSYDCVCQDKCASYLDKDLRECNHYVCEPHWSTDHRNMVILAGNNYKVPSNMSQ